jgi:Ni,Fe-hydrogenase I cytochrome b subunit
MMCLLFLGYIAGALALFYYLQAPVILLSLVVVINFAVLFLTGNYLLRAILFPYANSYIKTKLDSGINRRFSLEFSRLILLQASMVRVIAGIDSPESYVRVKEEIVETDVEIKIDMRKLSLEINQSKTMVFST